MTDINDNNLSFNNGFNKNHKESFRLNLKVFLSNWTVMEQYYYTSVIPYIT